MKTTTVRVKRTAAKHRFPPLTDDQARQVTMTLVMATAEGIAKLVQANADLADACKELARRVR